MQLRYNTWELRKMQFSFLNVGFRNCYFSCIMKLSTLGQTYKCAVEQNEVISLFMNKITPN